ncbi:MAG: hypothetical protein U0797_15260 [Gemmataceae bacterium]
MTGNNPPEVFDVVRDPGERRSVLFEHKPLADEMRKALTEWLATETEESKWGRQPTKKK